MIFFSCISLISIKTYVIVSISNILGLRKVFCFYYFLLLAINYSSVGGGDYPGWWLSRGDCPGDCPVVIVISPAYRATK